MPDEAKTTRSKVSKIGRSIAAAVAIVAWLGLVMVGGFKRIYTAPGFDVVGWVCLIAGGCIAFRTAHRWANVLAAILLYSGGMALLALLTGHAGPDPNNKIGALDAAVLLLILVASSGLANNLAGKRLTWRDRLFLVLGAVALAYGLIMEDIDGIKASRYGLYVMFGSLAAAWALRKWFDVASNATPRELGS